LIPFEWEDAEMKVLIQKQQLLDAINMVQKAVMQKATLPILEGIYMEAGEQLSLVGNCFDLGIACTVDADIREKGAVVIQARMFGEIIRRLPEALISIAATNGKVKIECMNTVFDIKGMEAESYPLPPSYQEETVVTLSQGVFRDMIRQTLFAVSQDENRRIMTGILLETKEGGMSLVALDGFRMAVTRMLLKQNEVMRVVIPGKNMSEILKILDNSEEEIRIVKTGSMVAFEMKNCRIVSKTIDGEFMNYHGYIPTQFETAVVVNRREFEDSLERASLISSDDKRYPVRLQIAGDQMLVFSTAEMGSSKENISVKNEGRDLQIGFNPKFLIDALKVISDDNIRISFNSQIGPAIICATEGNRYLYLILPVRIKA
jgi:DNA polymerase-3 subunit beta